MRERWTPSAAQRAASPARAVTALALTAALVAAACGPTPPRPTDAGAPSDAGATPPDDTGVAPVDAGPPSDAGARDAARPATDAGSPTELYGTVGGTCMPFGSALTDADPHFFRNTIDFDAEWSEAMADVLSAGGMEVLADGNAGGTSQYSEIFSFELLHACSGAELFQTETEVTYEGMGAITDLVVDFESTRVGVSVTRFASYRGRCLLERSDTTGLDTQARDALTEKLNDVDASSGRVVGESAWVKQILYVFADTAAHVDALEAAWADLPADVRDDTIVVATEARDQDLFIFFDDACQ